MRGDLRTIDTSGIGQVSAVRVHWRQPERWKDNADRVKQTHRPQHNQKKLPQRSKARDAIVRWLTANRKGMTAHEIQKASGVLRPTLDRMVLIMQTAGEIGFAGYRQLPGDRRARVLVLVLK